MKILVIKDNNRMIRFRNRTIRTPVELELTESELTQMRTVLKMGEIENFEILDPNERKEEPVEEVKDEQVIVPLEEKPKVVTSKNEVQPKSLLDTFMKGDE